MKWPDWVCEGRRLTEAGGVSFGRRTDFFQKVNRCGLLSYEMVFSRRWRFSRPLMDKGKNLLPFFCFYRIYGHRIKWREFSKWTIRKKNWIQKSKSRSMGAIADIWVAIILLNILDLVLYAITIPVVQTHTNQTVGPDTRIITGKKRKGRQH